jgi:hypothetical protein
MAEIVGDRFARPHRRGEQARDVMPTSGGPVRLLVARDNGAVLAALSTRRDRGA